jgi:lysophospholipase L1-like esterase
VKELMKRLAMLIFSSVLALFMLELGCRILVPRLKFENLKMANWPNHEIFQPSDVLPFELAPNIPNFSNSLGMRDRERTIDKPKGVIRVVFLGDSIAMYGRFTDLLEQRLGRMFPGMYEIWNCSVGGYGIRDYAIQMRKRISRYKPDLVIVAFCLNDLDSTPVMYYDTQGNLNCYLPIPGIPTALDFWLYKRSWAYRRWLEILARRDPGLRDSGSVPEGEKALLIIETEAARMGAPFRAVVFPALKPESEWTKREMDGYVNITGLLKKHRIPYLDLSEAFPPDHRSALRRRPDDVIHTNDAGDRLAADAILKFLREQGFVPPERKTAAR